VQTRRSMTSPSTRADSLLPRKSYDPGHVRSCANRHRDRRRLQMLQGDGLRASFLQLDALSQYLAILGRLWDMRSCHVRLCRSQLDGEYFARP
jgi:hypothetical protein